MATQHVVYALTLVYLALFQLSAWPSIGHVIRRQSSADLNLWREGLLLTGVAAQFCVMWLTDARWPVLIGPIASAASLTILVIVAKRFR